MINYTMIMFIIIGINLIIIVIVIIYIHTIYTHTVSNPTVVVTLARPRQHLKPTIPELLTWDTVMSTTAAYRFIVDRKALTFQVRLLQDSKPLKHQTRVVLLVCDHRFSKGPRIGVTCDPMNLRVCLEAISRLSANAAKKGFGYEGPSGQLSRLCHYAP